MDNKDIDIIDWGLFEYVQSNRIKFIPKLNNNYIFKYGSRSVEVKAIDSHFDDKLRLNCIDCAFTQMSIPEKLCIKHCVCGTHEPENINNVDIVFVDINSYYGRKKHEQL